MMLDVALTKAERQKAADLIQRLLDLVDDGDLADRPASGRRAYRAENLVSELTTNNVDAARRWPRRADLAPDVSRLGTSPSTTRARHA
jgi:hypothetical protein